MQFKKEKEKRDYNQLIYIYITKGYDEEKTYPVIETTYVHNIYRAGEAKQ